MLNVAEFFAHTAITILCVVFALMVLARGSYATRYPSTSPTSLGLSYCSHALFGKERMRRVAEWTWFTLRAPDMIALTYRFGALTSLEAEKLADKLTYQSNQVAEQLTARASQMSAQTSQIFGKLSKAEGSRASGIALERQGTSLASLSEESSAWESSWRELARAPSILGERSHSEVIVPLRSTWSRMSAASPIKARHVQHFTTVSWRHARAFSAIGHARVACCSKHTMRWALSWLLNLASTLVPLLGLCIFAVSIVLVFVSLPLATSLYLVEQQNDPLQSVLNSPLGRGVLGEGGLLDSIEWAAHNGRGSYMAAIDHFYASHANMTEIVEELRRCERTAPPMNGGACNSSDSINHPVVTSVVERIHTAIVAVDDERAPDQGLADGNAIGGSDAPSCALRMCVYRHPMCEYALLVNSPALAFDNMCNLASATRSLVSLSRRFEGHGRLGDLGIPGLGGDGGGGSGAGGGGGESGRGSRTAPSSTALASRTDNLDRTLEVCAVIANVSKTIEPVCGIMSDLSDSSANEAIVATNVILSAISEVIDLASDLALASLPILNQAIFYLEISNERWWIFQNPNFEWSLPDTPRPQRWNHLARHVGDLMANVEVARVMHVRIFVGYLLILVGTVVGMFSLVISSNIVRERMLLWNLASAHVRERREVRKKAERGEREAHLYSTAQEKALYEVEEKVGHALNARFEDMKAAFEYIDADRSGQITIAELERALRHLGIIGRDVESAQAIRNLFRVCDESGDGKINYEEFVHEFERYLRDSARSNGLTSDASAAASTTAKAKDELPEARQKSATAQSHSDSFISAQIDGIGISSDDGHVEVEASLSMPHGQNGVRKLSASASSVRLQAVVLLDDDANVADV